MEKQLFYVNLNPISMDAISHMRINDGKLIEYEITATQDEKMALERLLRDVQAHDLELGSLFTFKHFDEMGRDHDKNKFQRGLNTIYEELYRLGTDETKQFIQEIKASTNNE